MFAFIFQQCLIDQAKYVHFYYHPQTKLREGNVFTPVCDSVHGCVCVFQHALGVE